MTASEPGSRRASSVERLLDLLVYLPAGAALTALEDVPGMVAKGRRRVDQELRNARVVGRVAVQFGTRRVWDRLDRLIADQQRPEATAPTSGTSACTPRPARGPVTPPRAARPPATRGTPKPSPSRSARATRENRDATVDRAIPEYDTLSASQVVRRLDGLSEAELRAVLRHERASRSRRTVLSRAELLLGRRETTGGGTPSGR